MKRYSLILVAALGLSTFTGCNDVLDVKPTTAIEADGAVVDFITLNRSALGTYSAMQSTNYYGLRYLIYQDVYSDNMAHTGTFTTDREVSSLRINASNLQLASTWATMYSAINRANIVLRDADRLTNISEVQRSQIKGEMLFIRALVHFDLVKVFGAVPVVTSPTTTIAEIQSAGRTPVAEVYNAVIADLQQAESLLSTTSQGNPRRATARAAAALQARVHLQNGNNQQAFAKANQVIQAGATLLPNFADLWANEGNAESIFELDFTLNDQNGLGTASDPTSAGQKFYLRGGAAGAYTALAASGANGDTRFAATTRTQNTRNRLLKYEDVANNADNVMIIRAAEMFLIRAEASARLGAPTAEASEQVLSDINRIRTRARLSAVSGLTNAQALTEILLQRRLEFVGEGMRFMDLKRYNLTCTILNFCPDNGQAFRNLWPIPLQQLEVNPNLTQNPGY